MYQQNTAHDAHAPTNIPRNLVVRSGTSRVKKQGAQMDRV
jgi:hypothetical protein